MTTLQDEIRVCPVCEARFAVKAVQSCGSHGADSDFRPHYLGVDPLDSYVHACHECGFAGYAEDYRFGVTETGMRKIRKFLTPRTRDLTRPNTPFFNFEFMALIYEWEDRDSLEVGDCFLKASWVARVLENREKERLYQREAVRRFEEGLEIGECEDPERRVVMTYLIGDLHRRLNRRRRAESWFHRALEELEYLDPDTGTETTWLSDQIRRQIDAPENVMS